MMKDTELEKLTPGRRLAVAEALSLAPFAPGGKGRLGAPAPRPTLTAYSARRRPKPRDGLKASG